MKKFYFYNYPKYVDIATFQETYTFLLEYLIKNFPFSNIYQVGGDNINLGISDIDFIIVENNINGNKLYLRNLPAKLLKHKIILHEPFAIDFSTFNKIKRLTSFQPKLVYSGMINKEIIIEEIKDKDYFFQLSYYLVANYPYRFIEPLKDNKIDVRNTITKLKKLVTYSKLLQSQSNNYLHIISVEYTERLDFILNNLYHMPKDKLNKEVINLLNLSLKELYKIFQVFDDLFGSYSFYSTIHPKLNINGSLIEFSDNWKKLHNFNYNNIYYLPKSASFIPTILAGINPKYLKNIIIYSEVTNSESLIYSDLINKYLDFCDSSQIKQLIFDINFSVKGHNSFKYNLVSQLSKFKNRLL